VGETSRNLKVRVKEHEKDVEQAKILESAVAGHVFEKGHHIDFGNASIIQRETRNHNRLFMEGLYIRKAPNTMNRNNGMDIHEDWLDLLLPITKLHKLYVYKLSFNVVKFQFSVKISHIC